MPDLRSSVKAPEHAESTDPGLSAILNAITSLKAELLAKIDEKAETQYAEICKQISIVKDEMKTATELVLSRYQNEYPRYYTSQSIVVPGSITIPQPFFIIIFMNVYLHKLELLTVILVGAKHTFNALHCNSAG